MDESLFLKIAIGALAVLLVINVIVAAVLLVRAPAAPSGPEGAGAAGDPVETVTLTVISPSSCDECFDATLYQPELANLGVSFGESQELDAALPEAKRIISKYSITKLPAVIFSEELGTYPEIAAAWSRVGRVADDGSYILEGTNPPYYDLEADGVRGLVTATYLNDSSCAECYDVAVHEQILARFGMSLAGTRTVDVASPEGRALVERFGIVAVPTVILDSEAGAYPGFADVWQSVGRSVDGEYVFTGLGELGLPYRDLSTGEVVAPAPAAQ